MAKSKPKALLLFSGGLDSMLVAKILKEQKIKIVPVFFKTYFWDSDFAKRNAKKINLKLRIVDISKDHLKIVKKPKFGYGCSMNPCIDCHILMLKKAKEIMEKEKFNFVATGDVLGERPISQNRMVLEIIERESSLSGYLLRPLSAKLLKKTIPEKIGVVNRKKLYNIKGRSRKIQFQLAEKFKISDFPQPSGGCLLTDLEFGKRLKELLNINSKIDGNDIELLKVGRYFWFNKKVRIIVGRNDIENKKIKKLARKGDILIEMKNYPGPLTLIRKYKGKITKEIIKKSKELTSYYSTKSRGKEDVIFKIKEI